jgi:hypothetical protein
MASTLGDAETEIDPEIEAGASALSERGDKTALVREMGALVRELKQWSEVEAGGGGSGGGGGGGSGGGTDGGSGIAVRVDGSGAVDALADGWETATDPRSGRAYFYHADTLAVQWGRPRPERASAAPPLALLPPPPPPQQQQQGQGQQAAPSAPARVVG